jgi:hypothetical protein
LLFASRAKPFDLKVKGVDHHTMSHDMISGTADPTAIPANTEAQSAENNNPALASGSDSVPAATAAPEPDSEPNPPPLTPQEFRIYNRLAEKMEYFVRSLPSFIF